MSFLFPSCIPPKSDERLDAAFSAYHSAQHDVGIAATNVGSRLAEQVKTFDAERARIRARAEDGRHSNYTPRTSTMREQVNAVLARQERRDSDH